MNEKTLKVLEWASIQEALKHHAKSIPGKLRCEKIQFYTNPNKIKSELALTSEAKWFLDMTLNPPLDEIFNIEEFIRLAKRQNPLSGEELLQIGQTIRASRILGNFIGKNEKQTPNLQNLSEKLFINKELEEYILTKLTPSGQIKEDATQKLKSLNTALKDQNANLKQKLNEVISQYGSLLQETTPTIRNGRYVLAVKVENKSHIKGIVHDVSSSGATVFIEPKQTTPIANGIREIEVKIEAEIKEILRDLTQKIEQAGDDILSGLKILSEIDFAFAKAHYSVALHAIEPELNNDKIIRIKTAKHPILLQILDNVIPNNIELGKDFDTLIITGSNTGGKTITLKTLGLFILMTKAGLHIPCTDASIHPFDKVFADIGDEQSVVHSLSTFSGHINNLREIINNTNDDTIVLLDEIGVGTDPQEGSALAQATLEFLHNKGAKTVITTHYGELKALAFEKNRYQNASVEFDPETLKPTYKLNIGIPGSSNALSIAKNLGINNEIIKNAEHIYFNIKDNTGKTLEGLQKIQRELSQNNETAKEKRIEAEKIKEEYEIRLQSLKEQKTKTLSAYKKKFQSDLDSARAEIKEIMKEIFRTKSEKLTRRAAAKLNKVETDIKTGFADEENELTPKFKELDWSQIKTGDTVLVKDLNQPATIIELPDKNDNIKVQIGLIKTIIKKNKVAKASKNAQVAQPKTSKAPRLRRDHVSHDLSLRGIRVEEALDMLEKYLDEAALGGLSTVCIIHGHGTGVLKSAVRDYLKNSPYVKKFRPGEDGEGSDGVTIAELK